MSLIENLRNLDEYLWFQFVKKEEYEPRIFDTFGRFSHSSSMYRDIHTPKVSDFLLEQGLKVHYPDDQAFAVCITHDIDDLYPSKGTSIRNALKYTARFKPKKMVKSLLSGISHKFTPYKNFPEIMQLEDKFGAKSTFFFLAQEKFGMDFRYDVEEIREYSGQILDNGFEIGLHGGQVTYNNFEQIRIEKERIEKIIGTKIIGYRNHYLCFQVPTTWELLNRAGIKYDTTFGYHDAPGFRNGMCHPFHPYNLNTNEFIDILEIPLIIMDTTFVGYQRTNMLTAWETIRKLIDITETRQGVITILWHNISMFQDMLKLYKKILQYCYEKNAWLSSCKEIFEWWTQNNFLKRKANNQSEVGE